MKSLWIAVACLTSGCVTGPYSPPPTLSTAQLREVPVRGGIFDRADFDRDGRLSLEEADRTVPRIRMNFGTADTNRDGYVTYRELRVFAGVNRWETLEDYL